MTTEVLITIAPAPALFDSSPTFFNLNKQYQQPVVSTCELDVSVGSDSKCMVAEYAETDPRQLCDLQVFYDNGVCIEASREQALHTEHVVLDALQGQGSGHALQITKSNRYLHHQQTTLTEITQSSDQQLEAYKYLGHSIHELRRVQLPCRSTRTL